MVDLVQESSEVIYKELKPYYLRDTAFRTLSKVWREGQIVQMRWVLIDDQKVAKLKTIHCVIKKHGSSVFMLALIDF
jgi:hypothetical protein